MSTDSTAASVSRTTLVGVLVVCALLGSATVATAAVNGDFSGEFDGYAEDIPAEERSTAITVSGEVEVVGENAVNMRIRVQGAEQTVLDTSSVRILVAGESSVDFDRSYGPGEVTFRADEVPAGTVLEIEYVVHFTGGTDAETIEAGAVDVDHEPGGGDAQRDSFTTEVSAENSPDNRIAQLNQQLSEIDPEQGGDDGPGLILIGGAVVLVLLLVVGFFVLRDDGDPPGT